MPTLIMKVWREFSFPFTIFDLLFLNIWDPEFYLVLLLY